jgi:hypothetical protein
MTALDNANARLADRLPGMPWLEFKLPPIRITVFIIQPPNPVEMQNRLRRTDVAALN